MAEILMDNDLDQEAYLQNLQSLQKNSPTDTSLSIGEISDSYTVRQNERIIKASDTLILSRLEAEDWSLRVTDIIAAKSEAFKQNIKLLGLDESENKSLIPSVINISIINN